MALANLQMDQGTTFTATITLQTVSGQRYDLRGWSVRSQMRKTHAATSATATFTASHDGVGGVITLSLTSTQTAAIAPGMYFYDVEIYDSQPTPTVMRVIEGSITVTPEATK
jgi:hypothetical protein